MMIDPQGQAHIPADEPVDAIENLFTYHAPDEEQKKLYIDIRAKAIELARVIEAACPSSPDRTTAIRKLRECVMTANAAIATNGGHYR